MAWLEELSATCYYGFVLFVAAIGVWHRLRFSNALLDYLDETVVVDVIDRLCSAVAEAMSAQALSERLQRIEELATEFEMFHDWAKLCGRGVSAILSTYYRCRQQDLP
jgi:hypothetical protein